MSNLCTRSVWRPYNFLKKFLWLIPCTHLKPVFIFRTNSRLMYQLWNKNTVCRGFWNISALKYGKLTIGKSKSSYLSHYLILQVLWSVIISSEDCFMPLSGDSRTSTRLTVRSVDIIMSMQRNVYHIGNHWSSTLSIVCQVPILTPGGNTLLLSYMWHYLQNSLKNTLEQYCSAQMRTRWGKPMAMTHCLVLVSVLREPK